MFLFILNLIEQFPQLLRHSISNIIIKFMELLIHTIEYENTTKTFRNDRNQQYGDQETDQ